MKKGLLNLEDFKTFEVTNTEKLSSHGGGDEGGITKRPRGMDDDEIGGDD